MGPGDNLVVTDVIQLIRWITPLGGPMRANVIPEAALLRKGRPWLAGAPSHQASLPRRRAHANGSGRGQAGRKLISRPNYGSPPRRSAGLRTPFPPRFSTCV